tara:strand:- start:179 stop:841 length:663 start_codon:yes stop_codon:yes gene_type:complete
MTSKYWQKYNLNKTKLIKKITKYNRKNNVNFIESGHYNHTRDILALSISLIGKKNKLEILDYGSNALTLANLTNKIINKNVNFIIYDPFYKGKKVVKKNKKISYQITNEEKIILKKKFDLIYFGSSIQYQEKFYKKIKNFNNSKYILITHTPFSMNKEYVARQSNHINLNQNIYSLSKIISFFKKRNFELIFKSRNEDKYVACKNKKFKTYSLNLLFKNE